MRHTNLVILLGNVGNDPRTGVTKAGHNWANISLATQKLKKDNTQVTTWHRIVGFGKVADELASCRKGDMLYVEGELENNSYTNKQGTKIDTIQIQARSALRAAKVGTGEASGDQRFPSDEYPEQGGI